MRIFMVLVLVLVALWLLLEFLGYLNFVAWLGPTRPEVAAVIPAQPAPVTVVTTPTTLDDLSRQVGELSQAVTDRLDKLEERVSALERTGMPPAALGTGVQAQPAQLGVVGDFHKFSDEDWRVVLLQEDGSPGVPSALARDMCPGSRVVILRRTPSGVEFSWTSRKFSGEVQGIYDVRDRVIRPVLKLRHAACVAPGL